MAPATLVAVTGWGTEKDRQRSREAGLDAHLTKPVDLANIDAILQEAAALRPD
jgi:CheY-like chemotaxis protein